MVKDASPPPDPTPEPRGLEPLFGDLIGRVFKRLARRSRAEFDRAAQSGKLRLELRQAQRDLDHFWMRLGRTASRLVEAGELDHPALRKAMERIDVLEARIDALRGPAERPSDADEPESSER